MFLNWTVQFFLQALFRRVYDAVSKNLFQFALDFVHRYSQLAGVPFLVVRHQAVEFVALFVDEVFVLNQQPYLVGLLGLGQGRVVRLRQFALDGRQLPEVAPESGLVLIWVWAAL
jgi:hypothetical protein